MSEKTNDILMEMASEQLEWDVHRKNHVSTSDDAKNHRDCYHCRLIVEAGQYDHSAYESGFGEEEGVA